MHSDNRPISVNFVIVGAVCCVVGFFAGWFLRGGVNPPPALSPVADGASPDATPSDDSPSTSGAEPRDALLIDGARPDEPPEGAGFAGATLRASGNAISVPDQFAGSSVAVRSLSLAGPGWAVIYEDRKGAPGNILGAARFAAGVYTDVAIDLLRRTEAGGVYYAMLHRDGTADGFEWITDDPPIREESGAPIMVRFFAR
jgi:hypothetical protein